MIIVFYFYFYLYLFILFLLQPCLIKAMLQLVHVHHSRINGPLQLVNSPIILVTR